MRRTTLHRTTVAAAAAALLLVGCGTQSDGGTAGSGAGSPSGSRSAEPSASPSLSPSAPPSASPSASTSVSPSPTATGTGCTSEAQLTAADTGRTVCLKTGGQIRLTLDGTKERPWAPVTAKGGALKAINAGIVILPGDASAAFEAVAPGTARLTSTRPLCAKRPGQKSCLGIEQWTVTVTVRDR
ncbi:hypothetical protein ACFOZ0_32185 [Streptomyces yaanensis]|uniref:Uncharacterized protein n=1 Tax=Streptomyces yaanensis TaxID=1142239 RepID=A0ABV7SNC5_9ACTN|nr:hypothetical protein [Streptomyces sp. CGMCC 4.7035]WNC02116.1 hypothetical protein Q2K21_30900 [Streptomyces sp. CGMCC 4.7035]